MSSVEDILGKCETYEEKSEKFAEHVQKMIGQFAKAEEELKTHVKITLDDIQKYKSRQDGYNTPVFYFGEIENLFMTMHIHISDIISNLVTEEHHEKYLMREIEKLEKITTRFQEKKDNNNGNPTPNTKINT